MTAPAIPSPPSSTAAVSGTLLPDAASTSGTVATTATAATAVLLARARRLAQRTDSDEAAGADRGLEVLEFSVDGARYAVETARVGGVHPLRGLAPLPCVPAAVLGLVNVRGRIVTVVSLAALIGGAGRSIDARSSAGAPETAAGHLVLLQSGEVELAVVCDGPGRVARLHPDQLQAVHGPGHAAPLIRGVTADGRAWLDAQALLNDPRIDVDDTLEPGNQEDTP